MRITSLIIPLTLVVSSACTGGSTEPATTGPSTAASAPAGTNAKNAAATPASVAPDDNVAARFGDQVLTTEELTKLTPPRATAATIRKVIDSWAETALLATSARAAGFDKTTGARAKTDSALADAFVREQFAESAESQIDDEALTAYFGERRRARIIRFTDRAKANVVHKQLADALAATPEQAARIFVDFQKKHSSGPTGASERAVFDRQGRNATNDAVVQPRIAAAAFAVQKVNAITPPVSMPEGGAVIVQLVAKKEAIALASVPPPVRERAVAALAQKRIEDSRRLLVARLKSETPLRIHSGPIEALAKSGAGTKKPRLRKFDPKAWRQTPRTIRRVEGVVSKQKVRGYTTEEMQEMMRKNVPDGAQK